LRLSGLTRGGLKVQAASWYALHAAETPRIMPQ
jgi:hypothetical protein